MTSPIEEKFKFSAVHDDLERKKLAMLTQYAFFPSPEDTKRQELSFEYLKDSYILAVYAKPDIDKPIATATAIPMTQNLRGKLFSMSGIAVVATEPSYRRQHITATMMQKIFAWGKSQNISVSTLYPFKESFYARFGYVTLPQVRIATLTLQNLSFLLKENSNYKTEKLNFKENFSLYYDFLLENQKQIHGMCLKAMNVMKLVPEVRPAHLVFVYDEDDKKIGCMVYSTKGFQSDLIVNTFQYLNSYGKHLLFRYLSLHIDQFSTVKFPVAPTEHPENWFDDLRLQISNREWIPAAMARVVDVAGLEGLPVAQGNIIVKINDPFCDWNNGIFQFSSNSGNLSITKMPSKTKFSCELTVEGLTALVYGNYDIDDLKLRKWCCEQDSGSTSILENLFPFRLPFMFDTF